MAHADASDRGPASTSGAGGGEMEQHITIDCDGCRGRELDACGDCVVSFIVEREPDDALIIDAAEARAVRLLGRAGLVPPLRFEAEAVGGDGC